MDSLTINMSEVMNSGMYAPTPNVSPLSLNKMSNVQYEIPGGYSFLFSQFAVVFNLFLGMSTGDRW